MFKTILLGVSLSATITAGTTDMFDMVRGEAENFSHVSHVASQINPYGGDVHVLQAQQAALFKATERLHGVANFARNYNR